MGGNLRDAYTLQLDISKIDYHLNITNRLFEITKNNYQNLGTKEEQKRSRRRAEAYQTFASELNSYKGKMAVYRNTLLKDVSTETRDAILACKYNTDGIDSNATLPKYFNQLVLRQRSQDWIKNLSINYRTSMLIGGMAHTPTITEAARDRNISLISLMPIS